MSKNDWLTKTFMSSKFKKYKWIYDDKSLYIRENLDYRLIHYINLPVVEADEFRKNLGVENDKSIRIEREIITIIMKILTKENMVKQYQILGLPYRVDLRFVDHKFVIEIDEDGHPYYGNDKPRQKLIEFHGFTFIRINPDPDPDAGRIWWQKYAITLLNRLGN